MGERCHGLFGLILGHSFKPIYELGAPKFELSVRNCSAGDVIGMYNALRPQRYVGYVCRRCGAADALATKAGEGNA